jgi:hypothetical protein
MPHVTPGQAWHRPFGSILTTWDMRGMQLRRQPRAPALPQDNEQSPTLSVAVCKAVVFRRHASNAVQAIDGGACLGLLESAPAWCPRWEWA